MATQVYERSNGTIGVKFFTDGNCKVEQSHRDRVNINSIMARYRKTGLIERRLDKADYGDFVSSVDFHEAQNKVINARSAFESLPSQIRNKFDNSPGKFLDYLNDPDNLEQCYKLGLLPKPEKVQELEQEPETTE